MQDVDYALLQDFDAARQALPPLLERMRLNDAIEAILNAVRAVNRYVDATAPWDLAKKKNPQRLAAVLHTAAQATVASAGLLWPVMPAKCDEALACFGVDVAQLSRPARWRGEGLRVGAEVATSVSLFPRVVVGQGVAVTSPGKASGRGTVGPKSAPAAKPATAAAEPAPAAQPKGGAGAAKPIIEYNDFARLDLRVGT
ncbi:MAG: hypothetical protein NTW86_03525, partial [Candidatus Sumerlaeota bacterium]|nr:hypothetical protein [Candidatus Sumerlaeota bacterium]